MENEKEATRKISGLFLKAKLNETGGETKLKLPENKANKSSVALYVGTA